MMPIVKNWKEEEHRCFFARGLLSGTNCDFMDQYLVGTVSQEMAPEFARMIHHNNVFHKGKTGDQMGQLCDIIKTKALSEDAKEIDKMALINSIRNFLVGIQHQAAAEERAHKNNQLIECQFGGYQLPTNPISRMRFTHHQFSNRDSQLNLNNFILNPYDPKSGELPSFSVTCANYNQQNEEDDVSITKIVQPSSSSVTERQRKRRREN